MYSWGRGDYGVLGTGEEQNQLLPKIVNFAGDEKIIHISAGFWHNLAINGIKTKNSLSRDFLFSSLLIFCLYLFSCNVDNYELFTWGNGDGGKLGHGTEDSQNFPFRIDSMLDVKVLLLFIFLNKLNFYTYKKS
jgi:alpha-tubulin suppressor-like RCC1 family protein